MFRKVVVFLCLYVGLFYSNVNAETIKVDTIGLKDISSITITINPYLDWEANKRQIAEDEAIKKYTSGKVYFSKAEEIYDKLKGDYNIQEIVKDGQDYWKCIPKNPKTITVEKSRYVEYVDSQGNTIHSTEYYTEEESNPDYLVDESDLEARTIWYKIEKK